MTKEHYFELCAQMGIEPIPEEIPMDIGDLSYECQLALVIFRSLPDNIEGMSGQWLGKDYSGLGTLLEIYEVEDKKLVFELINILSVETGNHYAKEQKQKQQRSKGRK
jgi:hypothetical protein